jgi:CelD/BcsL family acetyltransferase involved in cellulose biosynthesis
MRVTVGGLDLLHGLREEWSALCDRSSRLTPFQRPEWLLPYARAFPPHDAWVLAVHDGGRLAGLLPLFRYPNGPDRTLAPLGAGLSDYLDAVLEPGSEPAVLDALWTYLETRRDDWDLCDWEQVPADSPLARHPAPSGFESESPAGDPCPVLPLPGRVEDLGEVVPTRQLANLRKFRRKAETLGSLVLDRAGEATWREQLDALFTLHRARWGALGQSGVLATESLLAFHREVVAGFLARGALFLHTLRLDGRPLACVYGFREKETVYCYLQGFDPEFEKLSPGVMVLGGVIEKAVREGARAIDFLRGRETYKYRWGAKDRETVRRRVRQGGERLALH